MKYTVLVREVHLSHVVVEADSEKDAIEKVNEYGGDEVYLEYSHTLDKSHWTVEKK